MALTFRYSGTRNRTYCSSIFHDDARLPLEHELGDGDGDGEAGVLWAERNSGDRGALGGSAARSWRPSGSPGRRRPSRMTRLALTSTGDGGSLPQPPTPGISPKSKSLSGGAVAVPVPVHRMEKSSPGSMSINENDLELPKEWPRSALATRRSSEGARAPRFVSHPREKLSLR